MTQQLLIDIVFSDTYQDLQNVILVPVTQEQGIIPLNILYYLTNDGDQPTLDPDTAKTKVEFISASGRRYAPVIKSQTYNNDFDNHQITLDIDYSSFEKDIIKRVELTVHNDESYITYVETFEVLIKYVYSNNTSITYPVGTTNIGDSNLMLNRHLLPMASWSTARKNIISNFLKINEPLNDIFETSFAKMNTLLRYAFDESFEHQNYERVFVSERPLSVSQVVGNQYYDLTESTCIQRSDFDIMVDTTATPNPMLLKIYYSPFDVFNYEILNEYLPSKLYLKKLDDIGYGRIECIIYGFDSNNAYINESVTLRRNQPTETDNRFKRITNISCDYNIELSTYVDLSTSYYVDRNNYILPPIVNSNFGLFTPSIKTITNSAATSIQLTISDEFSPQSEVVFKFDFNYDKITSIYVKEDMSLLWTSLDDNGNSYLHGGRLNIDLTKFTGNNTTINNNDFIAVSDINTAIGDWVDVDVQLNSWFAKTDDKSATIKLVNGDTTQYYDIDTNTLTSDIIHVYRDLSVDVLRFSLMVENDQPYIVSIIPNNVLNKTLSAMTVCNSIIESSSKQLTNGNVLYLIDGHLEIIDYSNVDDPIIEDVNFYSDYDVAIVLEWEGYPDVHFKAQVGTEMNGWNITNAPDTLIKSEYVNNGTPALIYFSTTQLRNAGQVDTDLIIGLGTGYYYDTYIPNDNSFVIGKVFTKDGRVLDLQFNPYTEDNGVQDVELFITVPTDTGQAITSTINPDY